MIRLRLLVISLAIIVSGCAVTGPADDGFENSHESVDIGKLDTTGLIELALKKASDSKDPAVQSANQ